MNLGPLLILYAQAMILWIPRAKSLECIVVQNPKTRVFETLAKYQNNKYPFNPNATDYQGNHIEFSFNGITNIPKNAFIAFNSRYVMSLSLQDKQIRNIEAGSFTSLSCLRKLDLSKNFITYFSKEIFVDLLNLRELDMSFNPLVTLNDMNFYLLGKLTHLNLTETRLKDIKSMAFYNLKSLENLNLRSNEIHTFPATMFDPLISLHSLDLSTNYLSRIDVEKWNLQELIALDLSQNTIRAFEAGFNLSFWKLEQLRLKTNYLTHLNADSLVKHLPNLKLIDLHDNNFFCEDLKYILDVFDSFNITHVRHPHKAANVEDVGCVEIPRNVKTTTWDPNFSEPDDTLVINTTTDGPKIEHNETCKYQVITPVSDVPNVLIFLIVVFIVILMIDIEVRLGLCRRMIFGRQSGYRDNTYHNMDRAELF